MPSKLPKDHYPTLYFYDVSKKKKVKIDARQTKIVLKRGSTKGHGAGVYYSMTAKGELENKNKEIQFKIQVQVQVQVQVQFQVQVQVQVQV